jgi:orotidine-5'-phosphate decarboxylase
MTKPLIIALDFPAKQEAFQFLTHFDNERLYVKVGMELFYKEGPAIIADLKEMGHHIFLDLKLHDIPNTVKNGMKNLASYGVDIVNVHAAGGSRMMEAAVEGLEAGTPSGQRRPKCIAVTQLTSTSEEQMQAEQLIDKSLNDVVVHYAKLSKASGLDGVVCSTWEAPVIGDVCGDSFEKVTPGIRLKDDALGDQVRIATPSKARELGSTAIVVGRSITIAENPYEAYKKILSDWEGEA